LSPFNEWAEKGSGSLKKFSPPVSVANLVRQLILADWIGDGKI